VKTFLIILSKEGTIKTKPTWREMWMSIYHTCSNRIFRLIPNKKGSQDIYIEMKSGDSFFNRLFAEDILKKSSLTGGLNNEFSVEIFKPFLYGGDDAAGETARYLNGFKGNAFIDKVNFTRNGKTVISFPYSKIKYFQ
jgi:hypothetical protein